MANKCWVQVFNLVGRCLGLVFSNIDEEIVEKEEPEVANSNFDDDDKHSVYAQELRRLFDIFLEKVEELESVVRSSSDDDLLSRQKKEAAVVRMKGEINEEVWAKLYSMGVEILETDEASKLFEVELLTIETIFELMIAKGVQLSYLQQGFVPSH